VAIETLVRNGPTDSPATGVSHDPAAKRERFYGRETWLLNNPWVVSDELASQLASVSVSLHQVNVVARRRVSNATN
jgi:hypothetical protein